MLPPDGGLGGRAPNGGSGGKAPCPSDLKQGVWGANPDVVGGQCPLPLRLKTEGLGGVAPNSRQSKKSPKKYNFNKIIFLGKAPCPLIVLKILGAKFQ